MSLLDLASAKQHIETDLPDAALQRLIDDADAEIIDRLGPLATEVEIFDGARGGIAGIAPGISPGGSPVAGGAFLYLGRKAVSISSVVERIVESDYTLAASDYELLSDKYRVQRKQGSSFPRTYWDGLVTINYVPYDETARRTRLEIDLVQLSVKFDGTLSQRVGDVQVNNFQDYQKIRESLFENLLNSNRRWLA